MGLRLDAIFQFEIGKELLVERLSARRVCRKCNRIVSVDQIRAGDQACASGATVCDFYQRSDDAPEVVGKRIEVYQ
ncbi:MAG: adenylate kinase, partial [Betaproteobacteria bacterium]|nr:adenylate kinase [Betaproteobacteria bacterium]